MPFFNPGQNTDYRSIFPHSRIQNIGVFRPVLQCVGTNVAHVLPVKVGGCGSFANQCTSHV